jgi:hypothetical protein
VNVATPLIIGIAALMGLPFTVKPTVPCTFDGNTEARKVTGVPWFNVGGAEIEMVFPLGVAITASCTEVDAVDWLPAVGMYFAMKKNVPTVVGVYLKYAKDWPAPGPLVKPIVVISVLLASTICT